MFTILQIENGETVNSNEMDQSGKVLNVTMNSGPRLATAVRRASPTRRITIFLIKFQLGMIRKYKENPTLELAASKFS